MTIELTSLSAGTDEHARFLLTVGTAAEWFNLGTDVGSAVGDRDLGPGGPVIGRVRWSGTQWAMNRAAGETEAFRDYRSANGGNALFLGYADSEGVTQVLESASLVTGSWAAGAGFMRWQDMGVDAIGILSGVSAGDLVLVVFADAGSVSVVVPEPPDPPDPPEPPDPDPDPPDPFLVAGRRYERVYQSGDGAPVFFETGEQRVLLDLGVRFVRRISVWLDSGRDSRFLTELTDVTVGFDTTAEVDLVGRVQVVSRARLVLDGISGAALLLLIARGVGIEIRDSGHGGFTLFSGYCWRLAQVDRRYVELEARGICEYFEVEADYPLLEMATSGVVLRALMGFNVTGLPGANREWDAVNMRHLIYGIVGFAGVVVADHVIVGPPAPVVSGGAGTAVYGVFDAYRLGAGGFERGSVLNGLRKVAASEGGWIVQDGGVGIEFFDRSYVSDDSVSFLDVGGNEWNERQVYFGSAGTWLYGGSYELSEREGIIGRVDGQFYGPGETVVDVQLGTGVTPVVVIDAGFADYDPLENISAVVFGSGRGVSLSVVNTTAGNLFLGDIVVRGRVYDGLSVEGMRHYTGLRGGDVLRSPAVGVDSRTVADVLAFTGDLLMLGEGMRELEFRGDVGGAYRMLDGIEIEGVKYFILRIEHKRAVNRGGVETRLRLLPRGVV